MNILKEFIKKFIKKLIPNRSCITCSNFAWWDGDYCCLADFKLLQESPNGYFAKNIIPIIENSKKCRSYKKGTYTFEKEYNEFLKSNSNEV